MDSWQSLYGLAQDAAQDSTPLALVDLKKDLNHAIHVLEGELDLPKLELTRTINTNISATSDIYPLPQNFVRLKELYVTVSSRRYQAIPVWDEPTWQMIKSATSSYTNDCLQHVFVRPGSNQFEIYPRPATANNPMTFIYEAFSKDLSQDDYTTGTITTLANGGTAVTFSGATLTALMVGRWLKTDDGEWYLLDTFTDTSHMALKQLYQGTAIVGGTSAFTIGEMSRLPIQFQRAPVSYAAWKYFKEKRRDPVMAKVHKDDWDEIKLSAKTFTNNFVSSIVPSAKRLRRSFGNRNPNAYPSGIPNNP